MYTIRHALSAYHVIVSGSIAVLMFTLKRNAFQMTYIYLYLSRITVRSATVYSTCLKLIVVTLYSYSWSVLIRTRPRPRSYRMIAIAIYPLWKYRFLSGEVRAHFKTSGPLGSHLQDAPFVSRECKFFSTSCSNVFRYFAFLFYGPILFLKMMNTKSEIY